MYVDDAGGSPLGSTIGKSMSDFAAGAASGAFSVNEQGGAALLAAIRDMAAWVDGESNRLSRLNEQPMLGNSNGANVMKPYVQQVANDPQGFNTQLKQFRASLLEAEKGIKQAMVNYQQADTSEAGKFK
ncbi:hypothetical protein [Actinokineospora sp. HUAS TT18]|uniref:hypothetical protein n=1 Tax=Actinokineospora sp. HUAS TT18 TaxID=3447451 RepID=UPI003F51D93E